jgi:hypothetical protein
MNRQRSYPGLVELFDAFYGAVQTGAPSPVTNENILETTRLCEQVAAGLRSAKREHSETVVRPAIKSGVLVTGGTGSLGAAVVKELVAAGREVRAVSRREPARWERVVGAEYVAADLSRPLPASLFHGIDSVIHTAAETAVSWNEHQRNSIDATEHVIRSAAAAGVKRVIHVSSVAVLGKPERGLITDQTALASQSRSFGPYVWGKLESERGGCPVRVPAGGVHDGACLLHGGPGAGSLRRLGLHQAPQAHHRMRLAVIEEVGQTF